MTRRAARDSHAEYSEAPAIGSAIETDSKSYDRIFGMLLGVRCHVSRLTSNSSLPILEEKHFDQYEKIDIPREGNHYAPAHKGRYDYKFKSYAPIPFAYLRHYFEINDDEYLVSLTADYMMSELKTIGRSSAMFYYTWDGRYVLKTLTKNEMNVLRGMLRDYFTYVTNNRDTLMNRFYGAYRSQTSMGKPLRFVIMNNIFPIGFNLNYKFDLKGSVINRAVDEAHKMHPGKSTWKENEFSETHYMQIGPTDWPKLRKQLLNDTTFLASAGVMDYSLLVGIHKFNSDSPFMHPALGERVEILSVFTPNQSSTSRYLGNSVIVRKRQLKNGKKTKKKIIEPTVKTIFKDSSKPHAIILPYDDENESRLLNFCGGIRGSNELDEPVDEVYFLGFIDFLQNYSASKTAEHAFKSIVYKKDTMSCIPPDRYSKRMFKYLEGSIGPKEPLSLEFTRRRERLKDMAKPMDEPDNNKEIVITIGGIVTNPQENPRLKRRNSLRPPVKNSQLPSNASFFQQLAGRPQMSPVKKPQIKIDDGETQSIEYFDFKKEEDKPVAESSIVVEKKEEEVDDKKHKEKKHHHKSKKDKKEKETDKTQEKKHHHKSKKPKSDKNEVKEEGKKDDKTENKENRVKFAIPAHSSLEPNTLPPVISVEENNNATKSADKIEVKEEENPVEKKQEVKEEKPKKEKKKSNKDKERKKEKKSKKDKKKKSKKEKKEENSDDSSNEKIDNNLRELIV